MKEPAVSKTANAALQALNQVKAARDDFTRRRAELAAERAKLQTLIESIQRRPVNRQDGMDFVLGMVDLMGRSFLDRTHYKQFLFRIAHPQLYGNHMGNRTSVPLNLADIQTAREKGHHTIGLGFKHFFNGEIEGAIQSDALCFFFGDVIKGKLKEHLDDLFPTFDHTTRRDWPKEHEHYKDATPAELASSVADRLAEIERHTQTIQQIDEQIADLDEHLAELETPQG